MVASYYSYSHFKLKFISKLGSRPVLHDMFTMVQFNNSLMKSDFGLTLIILLAGWLVFNETIYLNVLDTIFSIIILVNVFLMRMAVIYINIVKKREIKMDYICFMFQNI
jgi:hypothetical protein